MKDRESMTIPPSTKRERIIMVATGLATGFASYLLLQAGVEVKINSEMLEPATANALRDSFRTFYGVGGALSFAMLGTTISRLTHDRSRRKALQ